MCVISGHILLHFFLKVFCTLAPSSGRIGLKEIFLLHEVNNNSFELHPLSELCAGFVASCFWATFEHLIPKTAETHFGGKKNKPSEFHHLII